MNFQDGIESAWSNVAAFVPKLLGALVILIIGLIVAKVVASLVNKVLERVGFDRAVERGGIKRALERSKYDPSDILAKIVYWALALLTLQMAFGVFGPNPISDLLRGVIAYLPKVFVAILIIVIAGAIAKAVTDLLTNLLSSVSYGRQLATGAGVAVMVLGVFAALDQLEIAQNIVNGLWYAILAVIVGSAVVAFGGGGIPVARRYLERAAQRAERQGGELRSAVAENTRSRPSPPETGPTTPNRPYDPPSRPFDDPPGSRRMP